MLGPRTLVMGVINVTPDSFSDGGKALDPLRARDIAVAMQSAGADLVDIGAESTRPGAPPVGSAEALSRLVPVLKAIAGQLDIPVSVDTYKADVAAVALDLGAALVNDISGFEFDPRLGPLVASRGVAAVLMHTRGRPQEMAERADYTDVMADVSRELQKAVDRALACGVGRDRLIIDPGIGFAKRAEHSLQVLAGLDRLAAMGLPLLVGVSRKSFLTASTGPLPAAERDWPTAAAVTAAILGGVHIVRVHNVEKMVHVARVADALRASG
ncbi:MAG: dihydropteroate synthase [Acidimicrobiia bacterium]